MYCSNIFTQNEDCFLFVNECKMKIPPCSHGGSVNWSSLGVEALCKSQQPAVISSSLAWGDRAVQWLTQTAQYLRGHGSHLVRAGLALLKMYRERHWTCNEGVRPVTCLGKNISAWWFTEADPGSAFSFFLIYFTFLWQTTIYLIWPVWPISNCNTSRPMERRSLSSVNAVWPRSVVSSLTLGSYACLPSLRASNVIRNIMKKTSAFYLSGFSTWSTHAHGYLFLADLTYFQVRSF